MAIIGERWGLFSLLKEWVAAKKPIWGTCAGMILLSDHTIKQGAGNESIVGGLDVRVCRNFFGSQIYSFQVSITVDPDTTGDLIRGFDESCGKCSAVFIRAPAILSVGPDVTVLARIIAKPHASVRDDVLRLLETAKGSEGSIASIVDSIAEITLNSEQPRSKRRRLSTLIPSSELMQDDNERSFDVFVAVRQGNVLATAFHPELTEDLRWHR
jgi:pyridoxal 5'-phosphate synthase pdxT subunit